MMRSIFRHKWVVPVAALVLVLAIGAVAWGVDNTTPPTQTPGGSTPSTTPADQGFKGREGMFGWGMGRHMGNGQQGQASPNQQQNQQRMQSMLNLVRDKMSDADKATFDQLQTQSQTQQQALQKAASDLQTTQSQLRTLVDKYLLPAGSGDTGTSSSTTPTTGNSTT
jgi:hypothetical protein